MLYARGSNTIGEKAGTAETYERKNGKITKRGSVDLHKINNNQLQGYINVACQKWRQSITPCMSAYDKVSRCEIENRVARSLFLLSLSLLPFLCLHTYLYQTLFCTALCLLRTKIYGWYLLGQTTEDRRVGSNALTVSFICIRVSRPQSKLT